MKKYLDEKRKIKREEEEKELRNLKNKKKIWKYINRKIKKREWRENNIKKGKWRKYFMELLEGGEITRINTENTEETKKIIETIRDRTRKEGKEN